MMYDLKMVSILLVAVVLVAACGKKQTEEQLFQQADKFESESNWEEAVHAYNKIVRDYPESENADKALHKTAFIYYNNLKDFKKSIELHKTLTESYPESNYLPQASFMIGFIYANDMGDFESAKAAYTGFLEKFPENELAESVKWELNNLGKDVNEQVLHLFEDSEANGASKSN